MSKSSTLTITPQVIPSAVILIALIFLNKVFSLNLPCPLKNCHINQNNTVINSIFDIIL